MNPDRKRAILTGAVTTYGALAQTDMMIEEMSELTKELLKLRRATTEPEAAAICENIREEMADVQIMLYQMVIIYGSFIEEENYKLERLEKRLEKHNKEQGGRNHEQHEKPHQEKP